MISTMRPRTVYMAVAVLAAACGSNELAAIRSPPGQDAGGAAQGGAGNAGDASDTGSITSRDAAGTLPASADATSTADASALDAGAGCKRGIAANDAPSAAFAQTTSSPGIAWWYNWANASPGGGDAAIEFVPMLWGAGSLGQAIPAGSKHLLGFNEPNFKSQADLTAQQAASDWPRVEAAAAGIPIGSPAVNFCGSASDSSQCTDPNVTDPYTYLEDFFAACSGCRVDYVAVHWYNCDLPSLQAYLEGNTDAGGTLQGFTQFGKPIWLTELSCDSTHSVADQEAYMQAAVPYLENDPNVARYAWFSASNIPNAELANSDGSLTDLGAMYVALPASCR